jgi:hypothetical protein
MTARAHLERWQAGSTRRAVTRKDLHDTAEGLGPVQAGGRPAHDLDVIDLLHR